MRLNVSYKLIIALICALSVGFQSLFYAPITFAATTNLIPNPSVEQMASGSSVPNKWQTDTWGNNQATFQYINNGYQSNHSVYVTVKNYTDGDAKWYFNPISVTPSTTYTFTDYYMSNVPTHLVAWSIDANNNDNYFDVEVNVPASSSSWRGETYDVTTLPNTKKLTILHLIESNGWLQTDAMSLSTVTSPQPSPTPSPVPSTSPTPTPTTKPSPTPSTVPSPLPSSTPSPQPTPIQTPTPTPTSTPSPQPTPPLSNEVVPNYSMEQVSSTNKNLPASWNTAQWGTNNPAYEYATDGHDGSRSVKLTMSNYQSGDAKWVFAPQSLPTDTDYRFSAWFKTNTIPHVVAQYIQQDGSENFFGLPDPQPTGSGWQLYSDVFSVPSNATAVSVFFYLSNNGWVQTDDYHIAPYHYVGFNQGMVSLVFDDGYEENIATALPVLKQYGFKTTHCFATQFVENNATAIADVQKIVADGHEVCSHTVTHPYLTSLSPSQMDDELSQAQSFLQSISGQAITNFTSPYGDYNAQVNNEIRKYYASHRTTDEGFNSKDNFNPYRLRVQNMQPNTSLAQLQAWVNKAKIDHTWLILVYHVVNPDKNKLDAFDTYEPDFYSQMKWLSTSGLQVVRWDEALKVLQAQL